MRKTELDIKSITEWGLAQYIAAMTALILSAPPAFADALFISTGDPDGKMAMATRPSGNGKIEIETGDDFVLSQNSQITNISFTGLLTGSGATTSNISQVVVEIYRVFPLDSTVPPSGNVPTRDNSPSDVAFDSRDSQASELTFTTNTLSAAFNAGNSVLNGINKVPNQNTQGEGPVTGVEAVVNTTLSTPFDLQAGHYFFVPQVLLNSANEEFYWLSAPKPIVASGTPFTPDLQTWTRNENLAPDWLRVGTDIEGIGRTFNASFTITGQAVPEPTYAALVSIGLVCVVVWGRRNPGRNQQSMLALQLSADSYLPANALGGLAKGIEFSGCEIRPRKNGPLLTSITR